MTRFSKVLVVGGAGFVGSHIVDRLVSEGVEVTVLDNLFAGNMENLARHEGNPNFHFIKGDVRNLELVKNLVKDVEAVFNEAAIVSVPRSIENPLLTNEVNTCGTLNLLKACVDSGIKRYVQASSASVYGETQKPPIREDTATNPLSPYAVAELASEGYTQAFYRCYGLETVALRYFNVYGPRQVMNAYSGVIMIFLNRLTQNAQPTIYGDGKQTRDFVYVEDVVQANMLALTTQKATGQVFNIATGKPQTINQLLKNLQTKLNKQNLRAIHKPARKGDIQHSYASIEKAEKTLGYKPKYSLTIGLNKLVDWKQTQKI